MTCQTERLPSSVTKRRAVVGDGDADWPAPDLAVGGDEAGEEVVVLAGSMAVVHGDVDHLVASAIGAVPTPMLGGEGVAVDSRPGNCSFLRGVKNHLQRSHVRLDQHVGSDDLGGQVDALAVCGLFAR